MAKRKRLAIVGLGRGNEIAPEPSTHWDVWKCNSGFWQLTTKASLWFEIHTRHYLERAHGPHHVPGVIRKLNLDATMCYFLNPKEWPEVRRRALFPRAAIAQHFPRGDYHASSFDWLLSLALYRRYRRIELFGIDLGPTDTGEPLSARPCLEYWVGLAEGRGVEIVSHSPSLFRIFNYQRSTTPYHYDDTWRLVEDR